MRSRILHIIPRLGCGSAESQVLSIARTCSTTADIHVATCELTDDQRPLLETTGATIHRMPRSRLVGCFALPALIRLAQALKPDVIHVWRLRWTWPTALALRSAGFREIVADHRLPDDDCDWWEDMGQRLARSLATHCISPDATGVPHVGHCLYIPDDVHPLFHPSATNPGCRTRIRRQWGLPDDAKLILSIGRFRWRKRIHDLIWTADLLKVVRDDAYLLIVGDGPQRSRIWRFRECVRIEDHVLFAGEQSHVWEFMHAADCLWSASLLEDDPLVIRESLTAGLPVIATDIPAHRTWIQHGVNGQLFPPGNYAELARATIRLFDHGRLIHHRNDRNLAGPQPPSQTQIVAGNHVAFPTYADFYTSIVRR